MYVYIYIYVWMWAIWEFLSLCIQNQLFAIFNASKSVGSEIVVFQGATVTTSAPSFSPGGHGLGWPGGPVYIFAM